MDEDDMDASLEGGMSKRAVSGYPQFFLKSHAR